MKKSIVFAILLSTLFLYGTETEERPGAWLFEYYDYYNTNQVITDYLPTYNYQREFLYGTQYSGTIRNRKAVNKNMSIHGYSNHFDEHLDELDGIYYGISHPNNYVNGSASGLEDTTGLMHASSVFKIALRAAACIEHKAALEVSEDPYNTQYLTNDNNNSIFGFKFIHEDAEKTNYNGDWYLKLDTNSFQNGKTKILDNNWPNNQIIGTNNGAGTPPFYIDRMNYDKGWYLSVKLRRSNLSDTTSLDSTVLSLKIKYTLANDNFDEGYMNFHRMIQS